MRRFLVVVLLLAACSPAEEAAESTTTTTSTSPPERTTTTTPPPFAVTSPAFEDGGVIPVEYTCDGQDVSPALNIVGIPEDAESLALIVDDSDAPLGTWDHWVTFDIPIEARSFDIERATPALGVQGSNSWNLLGYMGPCPPPGEQHEYHFEICALSGTLGLPEGVASSQVYAAMDGEVITSADLVGTYARPEDG